MTRWLPEEYEPPVRTSVPYGHRLRREQVADAQRLRIALPGLDAREADRLLRSRAAEMEQRSAYTYALLDTDETALLGEVRLQPGARRGSDADVAWWIVPECSGTDLARALDALVPVWVGSAWPFVHPWLRGPLDPVLALVQGEC